MNKSILVAACRAMSCWVALSGSSSHAAEDGAPGAGPVPLVLKGVSDDTPYIRPICSKCRRLKLERQSTTGGTCGVLEVIYLDEEHGDFEGRIELTLIGADDSDQPVTIDDVALIQGEQAEWVLEATSCGNWKTVEMAWVVFVPE